MRTITVLTDGLAVFDFSFFSVGPFPDGSLLHTQGYVEVYAIRNGIAHQIGNPELFASYDYNWENVQEVGFLIHEMFKTTEFIRKDGDEDIYLARGFIKVPSDVLHSAGFSEEDIVPINDLDMERYIKAYPKTKAKIVHVGNDPAAFIILPHGAKRGLRSAAIFESYGYSWRDLIRIPSKFKAIIDAYPEQKLIRRQGDYRVYKLENGKKRWIKTAAAFTRLGFRWDEIDEVTPHDFDSYPTDSAID